MAGNRNCRHLLPNRRCPAAAATKVRWIEAHSCGRSPIAAGTTRHPARLENTAPAFRAAIEKGYGIECDLQAAEDGTPMVFHDDKLDRLIARLGAGRRLRAGQTRAVALLGQSDENPDLRRFLELVGGPRAAAGGGEGQRCGPARQLPGEDRAGLARLSTARSRSCPSTAASLETLAGRAPEHPAGTHHRQSPAGRRLWAGRGGRRESAAASRLFGAASRHHRLLRGRRASCWRSRGRG